MSTVIECVRRNNATLIDIVLDPRTNSNGENSVGLFPSLAHMEVLASCSCLKILMLYMSDLNDVSLSSFDFKVDSRHRTRKVW